MKPISNGQLQTLASRPPRPDFGLRSTSHAMQPAGSSFAPGERQALTSCYITDKAWIRFQCFMLTASLQALWPSPTQIHQSFNLVTPLMIPRTSSLVSFLLNFWCITAPIISIPTTRAAYVKVISVKVQDREDSGRRCSCC